MTFGVLELFILAKNNLYCLFSQVTTINEDSQKHLHPILTQTHSLHFIWRWQREGLDGTICWIRIPLLVNWLREWKQSNLGQGETELPSCHRTQIQSSRARGSLRMGPGEIRDPVYQQLVLWFLVLNTQEWKPDFSDPDQVSHWLKEVEPWWPARAFNRSSRYTDSLVLNFWEFLQALNTILQG